MPVVLANDASWSGWGWALADERGPIEVGHLKLSSRAWPAAALQDELCRGRVAHVLADAQLCRAPGDALVRVVVERPPPRYAGGSQGRAAAISLIVGALMYWGTRPDQLAYPWLLEPRTWRTWWNIGTGRGWDRLTQKKAAIRQVEVGGWGRHLKGLDGVDGPLGDVAESILLGVGAARRPMEAPRGPATWHAPGRGGKGR